MPLLGLCYTRSQSNYSNVSYSVNTNSNARSTTLTNRIMNRPAPLFTIGSIATKGSGCGCSGSK